MKLGWATFAFYLFGLAIGFAGGVTWQSGRDTSYVALVNKPCGEAPVQDPEPAPPPIENRKIAEMGERPEVFHHDQAVTPGFTGYAALGVRDDYGTFKAGSTGDFTPILMDKDGFVRARCEPEKR